MMSCFFFASSVSATAALLGRYLGDVHPAQALDNCTLWQGASERCQGILNNLATSIFVR